MLRRRDRLPEPAAPTPAPAAPAADIRPGPPDGAGNFVVVVLDSLRYDSCLAAEMSTLAHIGELEKRWSYASWTAPSHYNLLMGLLPHVSPAHVYASEYYKQDFARYADRLNVPGIEFKQLLPSIYLPTFLRNKLGYQTSAMVSMPVLNRFTPINRDFDRYQLMDKHNDMAAMVDQMTFDGDRPWFYLLNVGETHYPYALPDEDKNDWPVISGVHGVFKHMDSQMVGGKLVEGDEGEQRFFDNDQLDRLRERQVKAAAYIDGVVARLLEKVPANTWVVVTADHGELFGEDGYFGHGPIAHEKVYEVPFVEGRVS